ncbi:MAG: hypothetical protein ACU85V_15355 [Gammaproteobacteria bacterium]
MARYQDKFRLDLRDVELIERALRHEIKRRAVRGDVGRADTNERAEMRALNQVLGKIHNQKVFYAQVKADGVPAG